MMTIVAYVRLAVVAVLAGGLLGAAAPADAHDRYERNDRNRSSFSITLDGAQFGYYDHGRRWLKWRTHRERDWYRHNHRDSYYNMRRRHDRDRYRRDWRQGRRDDWHGDGYRHREGHRR